MILPTFIKLYKNDDPDFRLFRSLNISMTPLVVEPIVNLKVICPAILFVECELRFWGSQRAAILHPGSTISMCII